MKKVDQKLQPGIQKFVQVNPEFFKAFNDANAKAETGLKSKLNKPVATITVEDINALDSWEDKQKVINLGNGVRELHKTIKDKYIVENIIYYLGMDWVLCQLAKDVQNFFFIKDGIGNTDRFKELLEGHLTDSLKEQGLCELHDMIHNWQKAFNKHHLKRYDQMLFGLSYKTLDAIRQECFEKTYATYGRIIVSSDGAKTIRRDGTEVED